LEQDLSKQTLSQINNIAEVDLINAAKIKIKLDFTLNSLYDLQYWCPNLIELKINESNISSIRDIGC
jgi:hypothetical protein